jgi:serine/threonine protein kinase
MGVVYKAEDLKLKRTVALKFLPAHLSSSEKEKARFLQEAGAEAASSNVLRAHNHSFVVGLYPPCAYETRKD